MKKLLLSLSLLGVSFTMSNAAEIKPVKADQLSDARTIIHNACFELQIVSSETVEQAIREIERTSGLYDMQDIEHIKQLYVDNNGMFLVVLQDGVVAGMGAIKKLDDTHCELTRMFFAPAYRGQGLGSQLIQQLLSLAKELGYTKVRLNIWNPETQTRAINFYKKFGFYEIEPYKVCPAKVFMEKELV